MDLIYGTNDGKNSKDLSLPAHLPGKSGDSGPNGEKPEEVSTLIEEKEPESEETVPKAKISIQTQEEIDEWIRQRKSNWMKKISNNRPKEDKPEPTLQSTNNKRKRDNQNDRTNEKRPHKQQQQQKRQNDSRFNLNKSLIQRELATSENKQVLDFIKALFDSKIIEPVTSAGQ